MIALTLIVCSCQKKKEDNKIQIIDHTAITQTTTIGNKEEDGVFPGSAFPERTAEGNNSMGNTSIELAELEEQYGEDVDNDDLNDLQETN